MPDLTVHEELGLVRVFRAGSGTPILTQQARPHTRPYIHPIVSPTGVGTVTEDAPDHHPWQHGLSVGLNDVNGVGFWHEGLHSKHLRDGTFHPVLAGEPSTEGNRASWEVRTELRAPGGEPLLHETQAWTLTDHGDRYELGLALGFRAARDLTFGRYPYGGLFLRMPYRPESGGTAYNSEGQAGTEAEQQPARWVAVRMPLLDAGPDDDPPLVVVMDHPGNFRHPVPWRIDNELGVGPSPSIGGAWQLPAGQERRFHHNVVVFGAPVGTPEIEQAWQAFTTAVPGEAA
ncbi:DUF6807 domain-containing protein [Plantactinospora endophytica]|uniref:Oxidoreductase n=1 Tax=Plantactinospora endophytica TaxID=673535 RepID=A0ABQ4E1J5_9ACTN|nr:PmoA family protein [Plantactinospora endophytica]GIG88579.1 hypothetical protein Pen02_35150 [Plantactinospora endophytica]